MYTSAVSVCVSWYRCNSGAAKPTNCALYDKSTKFGTDVHMYDTNIFRYWATENLTLVSAILDFKMQNTNEHLCQIWCFYHKVHNSVKYWGLTAPL